MTQKNFKISEIGDYESSLIQKNYLNEHASSNIGYTYLLDALKGEPMSNEERMKLVNDKFYGKLEAEKNFYNELAEAIIALATKYLEDNLKGTKRNELIRNDLEPIFKKHNRLFSGGYPLGGHLQMLYATGQFSEMVSESGHSSKKLIIKKVKHGGQIYSISLDPHGYLTVNSFEQNAGS